MRELSDMITFGRFVNEVGCIFHHSLDFIVVMVYVVVIKLL